MLLFRAIESRITDLWCRFFAAEGSQRLAPDHTAQQAILALDELAALERSIKAAPDRVQVDTKELTLLTGSWSALSHRVAALLEESAKATKPAPTGGAPAPPPPKKPPQKKKPQQATESLT